MQSERRHLMLPHQNPDLYKRTWPEPERWEPEEFIEPELYARALDIEVARARATARNPHGSIKAVVAEAPKTMLSLAKWAYTQEFDEPTALIIDHARGQREGKPIWITREPTENDHRKRILIGHEEAKQVDNYCLYVAWPKVWASAWMIDGKWSPTSWAVWVREPGNYLEYVKNQTEWKERITQNASRASNLFRQD